MCLGLGGAEAPLHASCCTISYHVNPDVLLQVAYNELLQGDHSTKCPGESPAHGLRHAGDSTWPIADAMQAAGTDMIITSGHARESEWNIGFRFPGGQFQAREAPAGRNPDVEQHPRTAGCTDEVSLCAVGTDGMVRELYSDKHKVYSAAGNCLMGHISGQCCMALAWMRCMGVRQMFGYTVPTWYGHAGWGVHRYLFANVGALTFAEAYFASQQALLFQLETLLPVASSTYSGGSRRTLGRTGRDVAPVHHHMPRPCTICDSRTHHMLAT